MIYSTIFWLFGYACLAVIGFSNLYVAVPGGLIWGVGWKIQKHRALVKKHQELHEKIKRMNRK